MKNTSSYLVLLVIVLIIGAVFYLMGCGSSGSETTTTTGGGGTTTTTTSTTTTTIGVFSLTSSSFEAGAAIPNRYAKNGEYSPDIPGAQNISVPLAWSNAPASTAAYALAMIDLSNTTAHWLVVNIPTATTSLAAGASPSSMPVGCTEVPNNYTSGRYEGPWPPQGQSHSYQFMVYALTGTVDASTMMGLSQFNTAVQAKLISSKSLTGTFIW